MHRVAVTILATLLLAVIPLPTAFADGSSQFPVDVEVSGSSAEADGTDSITFSLFVYGWYCVNTDDVRETKICEGGAESNSKIGRPEHNIAIYATGTNNTFGSTKISGSNRYVTADENGEAQFTLSSTSNEVKTIQFTDNLWGTPYEGATSITVTFGDPKKAGNGVPTDGTPANDDSPPKDTPDTSGDTNKNAKESNTDSDTGNSPAATLAKAVTKNPLIAIGAGIVGLLFVGFVAWVIVARKRQASQPARVALQSVSTHNPHNLGRVALRGLIEP